MNSGVDSGPQSLRLDSSASLPEEFLQRLLPYRPKFERCADIEQVLKCREIQAISDDLSEYLKGQHVRVYHCTKQVCTGFFEARGLRLTDIASHQQEFLDAFASRFTSDELHDMQEAWSIHFNAFQKKHRNGRIWACLSAGTVVNRGAEDLMTYFGGESIYFPLKRHPTIATKLRELGQPVVVEFSTVGANLVEYGNLAMPMLERLHHEWCHRDIRSIDWTGYQAASVPPEKVLAVTPFLDFQRFFEVEQKDRRSRLHR